MVIKRLKGSKFGTDRIARVVTGYALYEEGKGYIAFSSIYPLWREKSFTEYLRCWRLL